MRTYEMLPDKKMRMVEGDTSLVSIGRVLFVVAAGKEYLVADAAIPGHEAIIRTEFLNSEQDGHQVRGMVTNIRGGLVQEGVDDDFSLTFTWDTIRLDNGKELHRPGYVVPQTEDQAA